MVKLQTLLKMKGNGVKITDPVRNKLRLLRLFTAVKEGRLDIVRALVEVGVDLKIETEDSRPSEVEGATATAVKSDSWLVNQHSFLLVACEEGHADIFRYLLEKGAAVDQRLNNGQTVLHIAASRGKLGMVRCAIEWHANVNAVDVWWKTPLMHAAEHGHVEMVRYLLSVGADVEMRDKLCRSALHMSVLEGYDHLSTVACLLESGGADVNAMDAQGSTCVLYACERGYEDILELLVAHGGADLDVRAVCGPRAGDTALHTVFHHYSQSQSHTYPRTIVIDTLLHMCKTLLRGGAHYDIPDRLGRTFVDFVLTKGFLAQGARLRSEGAARHELLAYMDLPLPLTCLSARACKYNVLKWPRLPKKLHSVVFMHKPLK